MHIHQIECHGAGRMVLRNSGWSKHADARISRVRCHGALDGTLPNCGWNRLWWNFEESTGVVMERPMQNIAGIVHAMTGKCECDGPGGCGGSAISVL